MGGLAVHGVPATRARAAGERACRVRVRARVVPSPGSVSGRGAGSRPCTHAPGALEGRRGVLGVLASLGAVVAGPSRDAVSAEWWEEGLDPGASLIARDDDAGVGEVDGGAGEAGEAGAGVEGAAAGVQPSAPVVVAEVEEFHDPVNAYKVGRPTGWAQTRGLETYASAAPLSAKSGQRIVLEFTQFAEPERNVLNVTLAPIGALTSLAGKKFDPERFTPLQLAEAVVIERNNAYDAYGRRVLPDATTVGDAGSFEDGGVTYYTWRVVKETGFYIPRETRCVATVRDGNLVVAALGAAQRDWVAQADRGILKATIDAFRLEPKGPRFVAPGEQAWKFWGV